MAVTVRAPLHRVSYPWSIVAYCGALRENPAEKFTQRAKGVTCPKCREIIDRNQAEAKARLAKMLESA